MNDCSVSVLRKNGQRELAGELELGPGMLFDPAVVVEEPAKLLAVAAIVMVGNPIVAIALVLAFRYPLNTAFTVGASLAQIGEFSFILAALGVSIGLLPTQGQSLIVAAALVSIAVNPMMFAAMRPVHAWVRARPRLAMRLERSGDPLAELPISTGDSFLSGQVVLVGYGRVGRRIAQALSERGFHTSLSSRIANGSRNYPKRTLPQYLAMPLTLPS